MTQGQLRTATTGEIIFTEGSQGDSMYVLLEGAVELRKKVGRAETILKTVEAANDFFGEMALIDGRPRSATAAAVKPSKLLVVDGPSFENMIVTNGKFALKIIKVLSDRIRNSNATIEDLFETAPRERFIFGLVDFAQRFGERIHDGRIKISIRDLRTWTNGRLGFSNEESDSILARLIKGEIVTWALTSAKTNEDILVSEQLVRDYNRRGEETQER